MKEIIPKNSRYTPIVQQKSCCVPACISMVMYRHGIPLLPQELLGYHLGLIVAPENKHLFQNARTGKRPPSGYGTQIYKKQYHPNTVFPKLKIPLRMNYYPVSDFKTEKQFKDFMVRAVKVDKDILACFDHGQLNGTDHKGGHVCVVDQIESSKNLVRFIDPSPNQPKWRTVKVAALKKAMECHANQESAGFWEFVKI